MRGSLIKTISVLFKRGWVEEQACRAVLMAYAEELLQSSSTAHQVLALELMESCVQQFMPQHASSTAMSLPLHIRASAAFRADGLLRVATIAARTFTAAAAALQRSVQDAVEASKGAETLHSITARLSWNSPELLLVSRSVACLNACLEWDWSSSSAASSGSTPPSSGNKGGSSDTSGACIHAAVEPGAEWNELLVQGGLLPTSMSFHVHLSRWVAAASLGSAVSNLVLSLVSLQGAVFGTDAQLVAYTQQVWQLLVQLHAAPAAASALPALPTGDAPTNSCTGGVDRVACAYSTASSSAESGAVQLQAIARQYKLLSRCIDIESQDSTFLATALATVLTRGGSRLLAALPAQTVASAVQLTLACACDWADGAARCMRVMAQVNGPAAAAVQRLQAADASAAQSVACLVADAEAAAEQLLESSDTALSGASAVLEQLSEPGMPLSGAASTQAAPAVVQLAKLLQQAAGGAFERLLQARLVRAMLAVEAGLEDDETHEDPTVLQEHALAMASLARAAPRHSLPLLYASVQAAVAAASQGAASQGPALATSAVPAAGAVKGEAVGTIAAQFERLWWLITYAGYILADAAEGETPLVPPQLNALSVAISQAATGGAGSGSRGGAMALTSDPCVMLPLLLLRYTAEEAQRSLRSGEGGAMASSPLLCSRLLWFAARWAPTYLMPPADAYREMRLSHTLTRAFVATGSTLAGTSDAAAAGGLDPSLAALIAHGGESVVDSLLSSTVSMLVAWMGEEELSMAAVSVLAALIAAPAAAAQVVACTQWAHLFTTHVEHITVGGADTHCAAPSPAAVLHAAGEGGLMSRLRFLPNEVQTRLTRVLATSTAAVPEAQRQQYLNRLMLPLQQRMQATLGGSHFESSANTLAVQADVRRLLAHAKGLAMAQPGVPEHVFTPTCAVLVEAGAGLLNVYKAEGPVCIDVLEFVATFLDTHLQFMPLREAVPLYHAVLKLLDAFVRHKVSAADADRAPLNPAASGAPSLSITTDGSGGTWGEAREDEDTDMVMLVLRGLQALVTKDDMDWGEGDAAAGSSFKAAMGQLVTTGVNMMTVLMTAERLAQPPVCVAFLTLCRYLAASHAALLTALPATSFGAFMRALLFGVDHASPAVQTQALSALSDVLESHADGAAQLGPHVSAIPELIAQFVGPVLGVAVRPTSQNGSTQRAAASALLMLLVVDGGSFQAGVQGEMHKWAAGDAHVAAALGAALQRLFTAEGVSASTTVRNQRAFAEHFEVFVREVRNTGCTGRI